MIIKNLPSFGKKIIRTGGNLPGIVFVTLALGGLVFGIMVINAHITLNMAAKHGQMIRSITEIKYESSRFHLWLEEFISGDATLDKKEIWKHIGYAREYANAMIDGGDTREGYINAVDSPKLRIYINQTIDMLERLDNLAEWRVSNIDKSIAGKPADIEFDVLYKEIQDHVEQTEAIVRESINKQNDNYIIFVSIIGTIIFVVTLSCAYLFYLYDRRWKINIQAINDGDERIRSMLNTVSEGIINIDHMGIIKSSNQAACNLFGYGPNNLIGLNIEKLVPDQNIMPHLFEEHSSERANGGLNLHRALEFEIKRSNGQPLPVEITANKMLLNNVQQYTLSIRDVSLQKQAKKLQEQYKKDLELQVKERTAELYVAMKMAKDASSAKSRFLSDMSHELRTPLNAILGFGQILEMGEKDLTEVQRSNIKEIINAGRHLLLLISDILDLGKMESGQLDISIEDVNLNDALKECISRVSEEAGKRHIDIINNIEHENYILSADLVRLQRVLLNILLNAVKYNRDYGRITLDGEIISKDRIRICISDTGEGISKEDMCELFTAFKRLNVKNNIDGAGIGLIIAKNLVEIMGGSISAESEPGSGSVFCIEMTLAN